MDALHAEAARWLATRQRKRIAVIAATCEQFIGLNEQLRQYGLSIPRSRLIATGLDDPDQAARTTELLLEFPPELRPDVLLILDDNLLGPVTQALSQVNVCVPEEMDVLAYVTWPASDFSPLVSKRLGFNMTEAMGTALDMLGEQRRTRRIPQDQTVGACLDGDAETPRAAELQGD
jgi:DNA-binding LacI/PurR family transcriptional regulator